MNDTVRHVKMRIEADAGGELVEEVAEDTLKIETRTKAERGEANNRVREIVAEYFGVSVGQVRIVNGHHQPHKIMEIRM